MRQTVLHCFSKSGVPQSLGKGMKISLLAMTFWCLILHQGMSQNLSGGTPDVNGRAIHIYTLNSAGGNPGPAILPYVPTSFGSIGQPMPATFSTTLPSPNHNSSGVLTGADGAAINATIAATTPTAQPTNLVFSSITETSYTVSFTAASPAAAGYLVLRKTGSAVTASPTVGVTYTVNSTLGDATVVSVGSSLSLPQSSLTPGTDYHYRVFSFNGSGGTTSYFLTAPLQGNSLDVQPSAQPTLLTFSNVSSSSLTGSFTAAAGADGYLVLRKASSLPVSLPTDGIVYTVGATLGDATVVHSGSAATFNDASLTSGTEYYYEALSYEGSGIRTNYLTATPLSGSQFMESSAPTSLTFSNFTATSIDVSFTAAATASGYLVIRKLTSSPTGVPVDGTNYTAGTALGDGDVAYVGAGTSFTDSGLSGASNYFYDVYSYTGTSSLNYLTSASPLEGNATTLATIPSAQPTALVFSNPQPTQLTLSWTPDATAPAGYIVLRKVDTDPVAAIPVGGTAYTAGTTLGDATVVYSGDKVTFTDLSLTAGTIYHYQVIPFNGSGAITNYLTTSPLSGSRTTLALEPTQQAYGLEFKNVLTTSLTLTYIYPPTLPNGYLVIRKQGSAPTGVPVDGTTYVVGGTLGDATVVSFANTNSIDESGLIAATTYFYTIYAYNGGTGAYNYLTIGPAERSQKTLAADGSAPQVTATTDATVASGANLVIKAGVVENESSISSVDLEYRSIAGASAFTSKTMTLNGTTWEFTIPAAQVGDLGIEFSITATNSAGLISAAATGAVTVSFASSQLIPFTSFGDQQTNYRIVSVPGVLKSKTVFDVFADDFGATYDSSKWRMFRYESGATKELNLSSSIDLGKGYWLIAKNSTAIDIGDGATAPVTGTAPYKTTLVQGWNQIGNPYPFNVSWAEVLAASGNPTTIAKYKTYEGSWNENASVVNKYSGGFVFSNGNTPLTFPVAKNVSINGRTTPQLSSGRLLNSIDQVDWELNIDLQSASGISSVGSLGMHRDANESFDRYDDFTLPRFLDYIELNHSKKLFGSHFSGDVVPTAENHTWEFEVASNLEGSTTMMWDNSYFGKNEKHLVLWDVEEKRSVDMREVNQYVIGGRKAKAFRLFFGSKAYVQEKTELNHLLIHTISPNPTDAETKISFSLAGTEESVVQVHVLNMWGQKVSTVFDGKLTGGFHEVTWSGKDSQGNKPAQGVYLVEIIQGKERGSMRLVVK